MAWLYINQICNLKEWKQVCLIRPTFHKTLLTGISYIFRLEFFNKWIMHQLSHNFVRGLCQANQPIVNWVIPYDLFKCWHDTYMLSAFWNFPETVQDLLKNHSQVKIFSANTLLDILGKNDLGLLD